MASNKESVSIDVAGRTLELRYDFNAFVSLEKALGLKGFAQLNGALVGCGTTEIRAFIWAGALHAKPNIDIEDVGSWLDIKKIGYYIETISEAIVLATGSGEEDTPEQGEAEAPAEKEKN